MHTRSLTTAALALALGASVALTPWATARPAEHSPTRAERALAEARSVATSGRDATLVLRDLVLLRGDLTGADRRAADALLARPTDGAEDPGGSGYASTATPVHGCGADVCLHWVETTVDAADPGFAAETLATLQGVHTAYVDAGYRAPKPDGTRGGDDRTDVYLVDLPDGLYGYCTTDQPSIPPWDAWAYCVLDNDYSAQEFPDPDNTPTENMQVTAAHEYFHAVQFGYDIGEDGWFMEATATWAEDELFDGVDDNVGYLPAGPLGRPRVPLDKYAGLHHYGDWIFVRHLTERFPERFPDSAGGLPTLVRDLWEAADGLGTTNGGRYAVQALSAVLPGREPGLTLRRAFAEFSDANLRPAESYDEGAANSYPTPPLAATKVLTAAAPSTDWGTVTLDHLTSATVRFVPDEGLTTPDWRLRVKVDMADRFRGSGAVVTVNETSGAHPLTHLALDKQGRGAVWVPFSRGRVSSVDLTLVNASTRFVCWDGRPFSCEGSPRDDDLAQRYRGLASR